MEFPISKKLFHVVLNPGTSWYPTVDLELVQTTRNVNGTRHSVRKFQPGKRATFLDFPLFLGIFQWDEPTKRVPFTAEPEIPEFLTKWKAPMASHLFKGKSTSSSLRNSDFDIPTFNTINYGKHSLRYQGAHIWSKLDIKLKGSS